MTTNTEETKPGMPDAKHRWRGLGAICVLGALLALFYWPLVRWLGYQSIQRDQLHTGGMLILIVLAISLRDTLYAVRPRFSLTNEGLGYLALALSLIWYAGYAPGFALPLMLVSMSLALAGLLSFVFGKQGVSRFTPAFAGFVLFGLLAGLFPSLDWPLRRVSAVFSARLLHLVGAPVRVLLADYRPPELVLDVQGHLFRVATECNGFGLMTSSLLIAAVLGFRYHLRAWRIPALIALAVPLSVVFNMLRIVSIALLAPRVSISYTVVHESLGLLFYTGGLAAIWQLARWGETIPPRPAPEPAPEPGAVRATSASFTLLYDGACPFCRREVRWLRKVDRLGRMAYEDIADPDFSPERFGVTREQVVSALHGIRADGTVLRGMAAVREAYRSAGRGWIMAPTGWPLLRPLFDVLYRLFARHRLRLGRWFGRSREA